MNRISAEIEEGAARLDFAGPCDLSRCRAVAAAVTVCVAAVTVE